MVAAKLPTKYFLVNADLVGGFETQVIGHAAKATALANKPLATAMMGILIPGFVKNGPSRSEKFIG
jgi:hypothetical protein